MSTRPVRLVLLRGSNSYQRSPTYASSQPAKSMGLASAAARRYRADSPETSIPRRDCFNPRRNATASCAKSRHTPSRWRLHIGRTGRRSSAAVPKGDVVVHPVHHCGHALPSRRGVAEQAPTRVAEGFRRAFAVPAREGEVKGRGPGRSATATGAAVCRRPRRRRCPPRPRPRSGCARCRGPRTNRWHVFPYMSVYPWRRVGGQVSTPALLSARTAAGRGSTWRTT